MSKKKGKDKKVETVELTEHGVILWIPEDTVELELLCKIIEDGKLVKVGKTLNNYELVEAHQEWQDNCERYVLTEEGHEYVRQLKEQKMKSGT